MSAVLQTCDTCGHRWVDVIEGRCPVCQGPTLQSQCNHADSRVEREGMTGQLGTVICNTCGYEREWNAY